MAAQPFVLAMEHEPGVAPLAVGDPPAGVAHEHRRVAAAVDEEERLLGPGLRLLQCLHQHVAEAAFEVPHTQVDDVDAWRGGAAGAVRQLEPGVAAATHVVDGLERGGCAAEHDGGAGVPGTHHREVAGGVAEPVLLLEREVMLLVDDEEPRTRERHEHRGARTHHHVRGAVARMRPRREPLAVGEPGVKRRHAAGEPRVKAGEELGGEADFGNEHERLAPASDDGLDEPQVHLRLAAAGDAIEHEGGECFERGLHCLHRVALLGIEHRAIAMTRRIRRGETVCGGRLHRLHRAALLGGNDLHPALLDECPQRPAPVPVHGRERGFRDAAGVDHDAEKVRLDRCTANPLGEGVRAG